MATEKENQTQEEKKEEFQLSPGSLILGQYQIIREIGRGGMNSIIYLAEDTTIDKSQYFALQNKNVAIKVVTRNDSIDDNAWSKFLDECVTSNRASNLPNIVKTYQVSKTNNDQTIIIVMEYVDGISLRNYLNAHAFLSIGESLYFFEKIVAGVKELHSFKQKIIHRDLKPENILLSHDLRQVKIIDFGISSVVQVKEGTNDVLTNEKALYGTYPYISPDIFLVGDKQRANPTSLISEQFDFYSLGVILFEMLTGHKPFYADDYNSVAVIKLPLKYDIPIMSDLNPNITVGIENIIFKCMASKPEDKKYRYHSAQEILNDINKLKKESTNGIEQKLLKPRKYRTLQSKNVFDVTKQVEHERFYEKWWFFLTITALLAVIIIITVVMRHTLETK